VVYESGNDVFVYVAGVVDRGGPEAEVYFTQKLKASNGQPAWLAPAEYDGPWPGGHDEAKAIAVDSNGDVYVTGEPLLEKELNMFPDYDIATLKYARDTGTQVWVDRLSFGATYTDHRRAISVRNGFVYVTALSDETQAGPPHRPHIMAKYDLNGSLQWSSNERKNGEPLTKQGLAVASDGSAYVANLAQDPENTHMGVVKYNAGGQEQWVFDNQSYGWGATSIALDANDNPYVTGWIGGDLATFRLNPSTGRGDSAANSGRHCRLP